MAESEETAPPSKSTLEVGEHCLVSTESESGSCWHLAQVLQRRAAPKNLPPQEFHSDYFPTTTSTSTSRSTCTTRSTCTRSAHETGDEQQLDDFEYYVHLDGKDRRLDHWISASCIHLPTLGRVAPGLNATLPVCVNCTGENARTRTRMQTRRLRNREIHGPATDTNDADSEFERAHESLTRIKFIEQIQLGQCEIDTWYFSPYPGDFGRACKLWICEYCLRYHRTQAAYAKHVEKCTIRQPPGKEVYRKGSLSAYEVDGASTSGYPMSAKLYAQRLCLLGKLFLDHKTLLFDVAPFVFYVLTEVDAAGAHPVAYFSKEKLSEAGNNVACIVTLPPHQRKGYGRWLIALSYELARREAVLGGPEKPLSDLGALSYRACWSNAILDLLAEQPTLTPRDLSLLAGIALPDVISTLSALGLVSFYKGQQIVSADPSQLHATRAALAKRADASSRPPPPPLDIACLRWQPPIKRPRTLLPGVCAASAPESGSGPAATVSTSAAVSSSNAPH